MFSRSTTSSILIAALALSTICAARVSAGKVTANAVAAFASINHAVQQPSGQLTTTGKVKVDGQDVGNGFTVTSGSTITTAKGSSAVVSLGKLGRVELLPESTMKLSFTESSIALSNLDRSSVQTWTTTATSATATTNEGQVVTTGRGDNKFTVDTKCGNTFVSTQEGMVEVRGRVVTQVPAGSDVELGARKEGCTR